MSNHTPVSDKRFEAWKKSLKKLSANPPSVYIKPAPPAPPYYAGNIKQPIGNDDFNQFDAFFNNEVDPMINHDKEIWKITFPKIASDLIESSCFGKNVTKAVLSFLSLRLPMEIEVVKGVTMSVETVHVTDPIQSYLGGYPEVTFRPTFAGKKSEVEKFLEPFHKWSGHELLWKGSFLKSKTSGKIISMRLTGLSYNVPDSFALGQPISYKEVVLV